MKIFQPHEVPSERAPARNFRLASVDALFAELDVNGVVVLPSIVSPEQLREMQHAFAAQLQRVRWNNSDGYQRTEIYRHMVEDVLLLAQGFLKGHRRLVLRA